MLESGWTQETVALPLIQQADKRVERYLGTCRWWGKTTGDTCRYCTSWVPSMGWDVSIDSPAGGSLLGGPGRSGSSDAVGFMHRAGDERRLPFLVSSV